jgi:hypothetical protein
MEPYMPPRPSAAVLILLVASPLVPLHAQKGDEAVLAAVRRLDSAWAKQDTVALGTLLAPEYAYFSSRGGVEDRRGTLAMVADTAYRLASSERTELKVHRTGATAVVESRWTGRGRHRSRGFQDDQRCSVTLAEAKRGWQVAAEHCTQLDRAGVPAARAEDVGSTDAILAALYDVISGPAGQKRDWDRMRSLFAPGARLIPTGRRPDGSAVMLVWTVDQYITTAGGQLEKEGFFEREIGRHADRYGNVVQVFSSYDSKHARDDEQPFARGINSIQLHHDGARWWVVSVFWESERPDNPIPAEYLSTAAR